MEQSIVDKFIRTLDSFSEATHTNPCIILYKDKPLKMPSGKSAWRNKGDAKKALTNAFSTGHLSYEIKKKIHEECGGSISDFLEKENIIQFTTFDQTQVTKLKKQLADKERDLYWLSCLEAAGVDNWEGIDEAVDQFKEEY